MGRFDPDTSLRCETQRWVEDEILSKTYVLMLYNNQSFNTQSYAGDSPVVNEARVDYLEIPSRNLNHVYEI